MRDNFIQEIITSIAFIALVFVVLNPLYIWMPDRIVSIILALMVVVFGLVAGLFITEKPADEREEHHRYLASRIGYLVGTGGLVVAIVVQSITQNHIDPWLGIVLALMILGKLVATAWAKKKK